MTGVQTCALPICFPVTIGVVEVDNNFNPLSLKEKPTHPKSNLAITGIYKYPNSVVSIAESLKPSARGELEITDINVHYLKTTSLLVYPLGRGTAWLDTGTPDSLADASEFVRIIERRQGLKIACLEEIAFSMGLINRRKLKDAITKYGKSSYGDYLRRLV